MDWCRDELGCIDLGDKRLDERIKRVGQAFYEKSESPINQACGTWADTKAAYRLFDNPKVEPSKILKAHRAAALERIKCHSEILAIQDTTFFNYDDHESKTGLGNINCNKSPVWGLLAHNTLVTSKDGLPLGLFDQKIYARKNKKKRSKHYASIEEKESYRWVEPIDSLKAALPGTVHCTIVADREADIFELMQACEKAEYDFVIRSTHNRVVGEKKKRWGAEKNANEYLKEFLAKQPVKAVLQVETEDAKSRKARTADVELRFCPIEFPAPWRLDLACDGPSLKNKNRAPNSRARIRLFVVEVCETSPPKGCEKLHWRLLTSIPVESPADAIAVIETYKRRWTIEIYHKVLKSGCKVEDIRLETFERLERCLTLYSIIACRLLWMTKVNQSEPEAPCTKVFDAEEWKTLHKMINRGKPLPRKTPSIRQAIHWMAQLGGFLARKGDGEPGIIYVWRGWQTLNTVLRFSTCG